MRRPLCGRALGAVGPGPQCRFMLAVVAGWPRRRHARCHAACPGSAGLLTYRRVAKPLRIGQAETPDARRCIAGRRRPSPRGARPCCRYALNLAATMIPVWPETKEKIDAAQFAEALAADTAPTSGFPIFREHFSQALSNRGLRANRAAVGPNTFAPKFGGPYNRNRIASVRACILF